MSKQEEIVGKGINDAIGGEMAKEKEAPKRLSRKDFVKGAAVGGAGVAAASVLASCAPAATPTPEAAPTCAPAEECAPCPTPAAAGEAGPVTLELFDPTGAIEISELHAPRLDTLEGKTICEVSDGMWEAARMSPLIRELLQKQFPTAKFIPSTEFPVGISQIDIDNIGDLVKAKGCDAVIVGNAG